MNAGVEILTAAQARARVGHCTLPGCPDYGTRDIHGVPWCDRHAGDVGRAVLSIEDWHGQVLTDLLEEIS